MKEEPHLKLYGVDILATSSLSDFISISRYHIILLIYTRTYIYLNPAPNFLDR